MSRKMELKTGTQYKDYSIKQPKVNLQKREWTGIITNETVSYS